MTIIIHLNDEQCEMGEFSNSEFVIEFLNRLKKVKNLDVIEAGWICLALLYHCNNYKQKILHQILHVVGPLIKKHKYPFDFSDDLQRKILTSVFENSPGFALIFFRKARISLSTFKVGLSRERVILPEK